MLNVIITSLNPAKITAVKAAFCDVFPNQEMLFSGISVTSDVSDQPMSNQETLSGARNRIKNAQKLVEGDFYVGIEAGVDCFDTFAWVVISSANQTGESRSATVPLPPTAVRALRSGKELGDVMDEMFNQTNIKQQGGAIAMLTGHLLTRSSVYHQALILALIPFIHPSLYPDCN